MLRSVQWLGRLALLALLAALPAFAQLSGVYGTVKDAQGKPVVGATVTFKRTDMLGTYVVKTNKKGQYGHYALPVGTYDITVTSPTGQVLYTSKKYKTKWDTHKLLDVNLKRQAEDQQKTMAEIAAGKIPKGMSQAQVEKYKKALAAQKATVAANIKIGQLNSLFKAYTASVQSHNWQGALQSMQRAISISQAYPQVYVALGDAYEHTKNPAQAVAAYQKAISMKPTDGSFHSKLAIAYADLGKMDLAKPEFEKAAQLDPANAALDYLNEGIELYNKNDSDDAVAAFTKSLQLNPNDANAWFYKGQALLSKVTMDPKTGKTIPAPGTLSALRQYLKLQPNGQFAGQAQAMLQQLTATTPTSTQ